MPLPRPPGRGSFFNEIDSNEAGQVLIRRAQKVTALA